MGRPLIYSHLELVSCSLGFFGVTLFSLIVRMEVGKREEPREYLHFFPSSLWSWTERANQPRVARGQGNAYSQHMCINRLGNGDSRI